MDLAGSVSTHVPDDVPLVLRNVHTELLLNVSGSRPALNRRVQLWDDANNKGNHWRLQRIQGTTYFNICPENDVTLCLGLSDYSPGAADGARGTVLVSPSHWAAQWRFVRFPREANYQIENAAAGYADGQEFRRVLAAQMERDSLEMTSITALRQQDLLGTPVAAERPSLIGARLDEWQLAKAPLLPSTSLGPPQLGGSSPFHGPPVPLPVSGQTVLLQHVQSHLFLNIRGSKPSDGQLVRLWDGEHDSGNYWTLQRASPYSDHYFIVSYQNPAFRLCFRTWEGRLLAGARPCLTTADGLAAEWEFRPCQLGSAVTIRNFMPMQHRSTPHIDRDAFLQVWRQDQTIGNGTVPGASEEPDRESSAWLLLPVVRPQESVDTAPTTTSTSAPSDMLVDEEVRPLPAAVSESQAPLPLCQRPAVFPPLAPNLAPQLWIACEDPNTQRVWYCSHDDQWASGDGVNVVRYQPLPTSLLDSSIS